MSSIVNPGNLTELKPRITVIGVGGAGGNAINNMIAAGIDGVEFIAANTDAQALVSSSAERRIQLGVNLTEGLGAGAKPDVGEAAAREAHAEIKAAIEGSHMVFIAAGMGGGTGTGATSVVAQLSKELGILTVAIVTKPFNFEGNRRMRTAEAGIERLRQEVDTLIVIPNQNLFRIANERTTFAEAFLLADQVLHSGIACITDLIVREGLINLDFADVHTVMAGMGTAMMGTGEAAGADRAVDAAELAILNPLLDDVSLRGAKGLLVSISGSRGLTLYEVDEAASRVRQEVDADADIIIGATFDESLGDKIRVSIVASGLHGVANSSTAATTRGRTASRAAQSQAAAPAPTPHLAATDHHGSEQYVTDGATQYEAAPAPSQSWETENDVVIELGLPETMQRETVWVDDANRGDELSGSGSPQFRPRPSHEPKRPARRLPDVEDFPEFVQQAYRAKQSEATLEARHPAVAPAKKRSGLLDFLTGRKSTPAAPTESLGQEWPSVVRSHGPNARHSRLESDDHGVGEAEAAVAQARRIPMPRHRPR